jgi:hypothetical protein
MANVNSDQIGKILSNPVQHVKPNEWGGRLRVAYFSVPAVPTGLGDTMTLCKLPKGARVLGGKFAFSVAQGTTATTAIGTASNSGKYRAAAVTNSTSEFPIASTISENYGVELSNDETIIATNGAAAWSAASFAGHILYSVD